MAESPNCNLEQKKSDIKEYILHAVYINHESKLISYVRNDYLGGRVRVSGSD